MLSMRVPERVLGNAPMIPDHSCDDGDEDIRCEERGALDSEPRPDRPSR